MKTLIQMSDELWRGVTSTREEDHHPFVPLDRIEEVSGSVAFYKGFSNLTVVKTEEGCVLIDTGSFHPVANGRSFASVRSWNGDALHTAIYTHGHVDHAYGLPPFLEEAKEKSWSSPAIIGHRHIPARMQRYIDTAGYNSVINERQFGFAIEWPCDPIYPTETYEDTLDVHVGGLDFLLHHAKGETDDHTWVFLPKERVLCTGDLFIWSAPNAGNPQKVQRYIREWSLALRKMAALKPEVLLPGHGLPVYGAARVDEALTNTASYLESLYEQTVSMMNAGASVDELIHTVRAPAALSEKPYLQAIYDEPEFIVRNIHRCLGGWYSGAPCDLKPAPRSEQATEILRLAGGVEGLLTRAQALVAEENYRMACHFVDWAVEAEPDSAEPHRVRAEIYSARAQAEASTMARGVYNAAARESQERCDAESSD